MPLTNEQHMADFLQWVSANMERVRRNLRKNITFDPDIFDDVIQSSILRVCNAIQGGTRIDDFESYLYICSKFEYINVQNRRRRESKRCDADVLWDISHGRRSDTIEDESGEYVDRDGMIRDLFQRMSVRLNEVFPPDECDIFMIYYRLKSEKAGVSYAKLAQITQRDVREIGNIIQKIRSWVRGDGELRKMSRRIMR